MEKIEAEISKSADRTEYCEKLRLMKAFWEKEDCKTRLRKRYSDRQLLALPTEVQKEILSRTCY